MRISGPAADDALLQLARSLPPPRQARLAELRAGDEPLDQALILRFPGPGSATGEDLVELHLHGGRAVVGAVLDTLSRLPGLRKAEAGEFTRRAFENGRIDLAEAEGLADLLSSETESQRRAAVSLAGGTFSRRIDSWQAQLLALSAEAEAELDFADESDVTEQTLRRRRSIADLVGDLDDWLARPPVERLREGIRVAIAGPPNAGKSSLLNALVGRAAAITSPIAGTTRDVIEVPVALDGVPFLLSDTAGLREAEESIELIGVERARQVIEQADLLLWLGDPDESPSDSAIIVQTKIDLVERDERAAVALSSVTGEGLSDLIKIILANSADLLPGTGEVAISRRHRSLLRKARDWLAEALETRDLLIIAESLRQARLALDRITGRAGVEDMLDHLFGRFCIGK